MSREIPKEPHELWRHSVARGVGIEWHPEEEPLTGPHPADDHIRPVGGVAPVVDEERLHSGALQLVPRSGAGGDNRKLKGRHTDRIAVVLGDGKSRRSRNGGSE